MSEKEITNTSVVLRHYTADPHFSSGTLPPPSCHPFSLRLTYRLSQRVSLQILSSYIDIRVKNLTQNSWKNNFFPSSYAINFKILPSENSYSHSSFVRFSLPNSAILFRSRKINIPFGKKLFIKNIFGYDEREWEGERESREDETWLYVALVPA